MDFLVGNLGYFLANRVLLFRTVSSETIFRHEPIRQRLKKNPEMQLFFIIFGIASRCAENANVMA